MFEADDSGGDVTHGDTTDDTLVDLVLPAQSIGGEYADLQAVSAAMRECELLGGDNEISAYDDEELGVQMLEILGDSARVAFPCYSVRPILCAHLKMIDRFCSIDVDLLDDTGQHRSMNLSNHRSVATIDGAYADLPMQLTSGWNHLAIDLNSVTRTAFGTGLSATCQVAVNGSCRVAKLFFEQEAYADAQLPGHLQALST
eukprot:TRINITY_DN16053_c0_g1_i1.p1 TRINITY_DN16053_c0_g1~~TRINITY_DN16053_c0_g1_i1.p1  ORF type:complete len:201 (-),score=53.33 TRINITY_DN16053_c0_g1_i1:92-694(-)